MNSERNTTGGILLKSPEMKDLHCFTFEFNLFYACCSCSYGGHNLSQFD